MFTRKRAPLIGVRTWKDIHEDVKESIATDVLVMIMFASVQI
jgi:di/tricarboxylate transporter